MYAQEPQKSIPKEHIVAKATSRRKRPKTEEQRKRAFQAVRSGDLNKLFRHRYGGEFYVFPADDHAGREDLRILADHYAYANPARMAKIVALRAPWLRGAELDDFMAEVMQSPRMWKAQELGDHMSLTEADRRKLGIRSIGSIDMTPRQRKAARKVRDKERKAAARRAKGATPREQAKSRTKPWDLAGVSRPTWYRRQSQISETDLSTVTLTNTRTKSSHGSKPMERPYQSVVRLPVGAVAGHVGTGGETVHKAGKASLASRHKQHLGNAESRRDESVSRKAA